MKRNWDAFFASVFFVLGFSFVFATLGVLLQTILISVSAQTTQILSRVGGVIIILFSLYLLGLIQPKFLQKSHGFQPKHKIGFKYLTAFIFGASFAVAWTPCVGAILGAILTLAVIQPSIAFFLLLSYSLGLGVPFLLMGLFIDKSKKIIGRFYGVSKYINKIFGVLLLALGVLVFTNQLSRIANFTFASNILINLNFGGLSNVGALSIGIAFMAGIASFLSPCVLPILPAYFAYILTISSQENERPKAKN